jgi:hypothetical protein
MLPGLQRHQSFLKYNREQLPPHNRALWENIKKGMVKEEESKQERRERKIKKRKEANK